MDLIVLTPSARNVPPPQVPYARLRFLVYSIPTTGTGSLQELVSNTEIQVEAAYYKIVIEQGSQYSVPFKWYDVDQTTPIDLTNKALEIVIVQNKGDASPVYVFGSPTNLTKDVNGNIVPIIPPEVVSGFTFGRGFYELAVINYDGAAITPAGGYTAAAIDVDNGSGRAVITADGGTPYAALAAGDMIQVSNLSDGLNDGVYKLYSAADNELVLTLPMNGEDLASESSISIQPLNEDTRKKLCEGPVIITREAKSGT